MFRYMSLRKIVLFIVGNYLALSAISSPLSAQETANKSIHLVIDYNDGVQKYFTKIPWKDDMTVLDAMNFVQIRPHGITFTYTGQGETAFLTQIDDLENEGGGKDKKNWLYWVNGVFANTGFGNYRVQPADTVLWKFDIWPEEEK